MITHKLQVSYDLQLLAARGKKPQGTAGHLKDLNLEVYRLKTDDIYYLVQQPGENHVIVSIKGLSCPGCPRIATRARVSFSHFVK